MTKRLQFIAILLILLFCSPASRAASMETLKDYKTAFIQAVQNSTVADSEVTRLVNEGIMEVATVLKCIHKKDTLVTTSGNSDYAVNSDLIIGGIFAVELKKDGMRNGLDSLPHSLIGEKFESSGDPNSYSVWGQIITIHPEGTAEPCTLIVKYASEPDYVDGDADIVQLPNEYAWLAVMYAQIRHYQNLLMFSQAAALQNAFDAAVDRIYLKLWGVRRAQ